MNANCLYVDYATNPRLKDILSRLETGGNIELRMSLQMVTSDNEKAELRIKKIIVPESFNMSDDDDGAVRPDANEPAMIVMRTGQTKSNVKAEPASVSY